MYEEAGLSAGSVDHSHRSRGEMIEALSRDVLMRFGERQLRETADDPVDATVVPL